MSHRWMLVATILVTLIAVPAVGAGPACAVVEGTGINGAQIGASVEAALAITGAPVRQQPRGTEVVYELRSPWAQMIVEYGLVTRISTRAPECQTSRGVGPGSPIPAVRAAYAGASVSIVQPGPSGEVLSYPFIGVAFVLSGDRVDAVEVFRAEGQPPARVPPSAPAQPQPSPGGTPAASPSPAPTTAPGAWGIRSTSVRVEGTDFIVSGTVENKSSPLAAYAEVRAFNAAGRQVGEGNTPLVPSLVPTGGTATFEVRVTITDTVRRYVVTIRPAGGRATPLAELAAEVKDPKIFTAFIAKALQVNVQARSPNPTRTEFVVAITNGSAYSITSATVRVEINVTCRFTAQTPPRFAQEIWTGTATVEQLRAGASTQSPLALSGGLCEGVAVSWSASQTVTDLKVGD